MVRTMVIATLEPARREIGDVLARRLRRAHAVVKVSLLQTWEFRMSDIKMVPAVLLCAVIISSCGFVKDPREPSATPSDGVDASTTSLTTSTTQPASSTTQPASSTTQPASSTTQPDTPPEVPEDRSSEADDLPYEPSQRDVRFRHSEGRDLEAAAAEADPRLAFCLSATTAMFGARDLLATPDSIPPEELGRFVEELDHWITTDWSAVLGTPYRGALGVLLRNLAAWHDQRNLAHGTAELKAALGGLLFENAAAMEGVRAELPFICPEVPWGG